MSIIVMKTGGYKNEDAIDNLIHYMYSSHYFCRGDAYMVFNSSPDYIIQGFKMIQEHFRETDKKRVQHIIIGFSKIEEIKEGMAWCIAESAITYIGNRFQCCYAIHHGSKDDPDYIHIHLAINPVSWLDGNRYYENDQNLYDLKSALNYYTLGMYQWNIVRDPSTSWEIQ